MLVLPTLHPAYLLRSADGEAGAAKFLHTVINDFKKAKAMLKRPPDWNEDVIWKKDQHGRLINLFPTLDEVYAFIERTKQAGALLAVDVETTGEQPLYCQLICVGMANSLGDAICVPILCQGGRPYWAPEAAREIFRVLKDLMEDASIKKVFHNGSFDTVVFYGNGIRVKGWEDDTMQAKHVVDGELPNGLAFCASRYLEIPYWKDDVKGDLKWLDLDDQVLRSYNLRDCLTTIRLLPILREEIFKLDLSSLYWEEIRCCQIMTRATIRGLEVDYQRRDDPTLDPKDLDTDGDPRPKGLGPRLRMQRDKALMTLHRIAGSAAFNPRSPVHLRYLLFEKLGFPVVKRSETGQPSTDKDAMVLLGLSAETDDQKQALRALIFYRQADKMLGTWVEGLPILADNRLHSSFKLLPVTGRFSTSPNNQNWNKAIKRIFKSGKGQKFVSVDLSQAELRVMAYLSGDPELLRMYREGINVHTVNATLLFQVKCPPEAADHINPATEAYLREMCPKILGMDYDGVDAQGNPNFPVAPKKKWSKGFRTLAKNFVFGDNYGAEAATLYQVIRAKRDPDTNELLFPDVELGDIEALKVQWEKIHPWIPRWWETVIQATHKAGHYRCPVSGRIQWYRAGFKRNEMLNRPIQSLVASWMNRQMIKIADELEAGCGTAAEIVMQVHDMLAVEAPEPLVKWVGEVMQKHLNEHFDLPGIPNATLPCDPPTVGDYLDEI